LVKALLDEVWLIFIFSNSGWVTRRVSLVEQKLVTLPKHLSLPRFLVFFFWVAFFFCPVAFFKHYVLSF
jgi:hypothetical protein